MIYYTSDLHFGHSNILSFDGRPFADMVQMEQELIRRWNDVVNSDDTVYILGDFCWGVANEWKRIVPQLKGIKVLIRGNHDLKADSMPAELRKMFADVKDYKEITDDSRHVIMSHYPMPFYKADYNPYCYMLYGHLHNTIEEKFMQNIKKYVKENDGRDRSSNQCNFYNCWCGFYDYKPVTLDEIIEYWKDK